MMRRPPTSTRTTTRHPYTARFRSTHIDGKLIYGSSLDDSIKLMRGKPGTKIALTLVRPGRDKPIDVTLTREVIVQKPVKRSAEHTSELQSLMRISYAVFCLQTQHNNQQQHINTQ